MLNKRLAADLNIAVVYTWVTNIVIIPVMDLDGVRHHHWSILTSDLEVD